MKQKILTVIVPAKNEELNIEKTILGIIKLAENLNIEFEIIAINDGSQDKTPEILKKLQTKYNFLNVLNHETSKGIGFSFLEASKCSSGEYLLMVPGDNENDPTSIFEILKDGIKEDLLISYVVNTSQRSLLRRVLSRLYTKCINIIFNMNLKYYNGTSVYKADLIKKIDLKSTGFFFTAEILVKLFSKPLTHREIDIYLNDVKSLKSSSLTWRSFKHVCIDFWQTFRWYYFFSKRDLK